MRRQRVYIDTSVIGGCFDEEFTTWSSLLFREFEQGLRIAVVSDLTRREIEGAPPEVRKRLDGLRPENMESVFLTEEAEELARRYVEDGIVTRKHLADAQHIAIASVERVDVLVSWNFQHVVNLSRVRAFNAVNLKTGYPLLEIRCPRELVHGKDV